MFLCLHSVCVCREEQEHTVKPMWQVLKTGEFGKEYICSYRTDHSTFIYVWNISKLNYRIKGQRKVQRPENTNRNYPSGWTALLHVCPQAGFTNNSRLLWQTSLWPVDDTWMFLRAIRSFTRISGLILILLIGEIRKKERSNKTQSWWCLRETYTSHSRH